MVYTCEYASPLGTIMLESDGEALTGLRFNGDGQSTAAAYGRREGRHISVFSEAERWLDIYFSGRAPGFTPPLRYVTTPFRRAVYEAVTAVPYGCTTTYGEISKALARPYGAVRMSAQAAGGALGHNPILLIIPCHRVVGAGGNLTGYSGGLDRKARLLELEGADMSRLIFPDKSSLCDNRKG